MWCTFYYWSLSVVGVLFGRHALKVAIVPRIISVRRPQVVKTNRSHLFSVFGGPIVPNRLMCTPIVWIALTLLGQSIFARLGEVLLEGLYVRHQAVEKLQLGFLDVHAGGNVQVV